jgi:hypothetical protein
MVTTLQSLKFEVRISSNVFKNLNSYLTANTSSIHYKYQLAIVVQIDNR